MKKLFIILLLCFSMAGTAAALEKLDAVWLNKAIEEDLLVFPVTGGDFYYDDSWGARRTYGGERAHYGTDIMDPWNTPHRLQVVSMTQGKVTKLGWNERGGYRVGITSGNGIYYYYAHLDAYREGLAVGDIVRPGDLLGWMGDTGYGPEGTTGMFPVHLHVGILNNPDGEGEDWINPYPYLKKLG